MGRRDIEAHVKDPRPGDPPTAGHPESLISKQTAEALLRKDAGLMHIPDGGANNRAAAAAMRNTSDAPHPMTFQMKQPDGSVKTVTGTEFKQDGKQIFVSSDNQFYQGVKAKDGSLQSLQPISQDGKALGEPLKVTAERTGNPPAGQAAEKYISTSPKASESRELSKDPQSAKAEQKIASKDEQKNNLKQEQLERRENAPQQIAIAPAEKSEPKATKIEHVSRTPVAPVEFARTHIPETVAPTKIESRPTISPAPNTHEYAREFINNRVTTQSLQKPSLESRSEYHSAPQPLKSETSKPEQKVDPSPMSRQDAGAPRSQSKPETFSTRKDVIDQIVKPGDKGGTRVPLKFDIPLPILLPGRKLEPKSGKSEQADRSSKQMDKTPRLEPSLKAVLQKFEQQAPKDKLLDCALKFKENESDNLSSSDRKIAGRMSQLEPKQLDLLIGWAQNKTTIKFAELPSDIQKKLSSLFENIVSAVKFEDSKSVKQDASKQDSKISTIEQKAERMPTKIADAESKNRKLDDKSLSETKTVELQAPQMPVQIDQTVQLEEQSESMELESEDSEDTETRKAGLSGLTQTVISGTLYNGKPPRRPTDKRLTERQNTNQEHTKDSSKELSKIHGAKVTLLSNTARLQETGSVDDNYKITLETLLQDSWITVLSCSVKDDEALYIQHYAHRTPFKQSITVQPKITEIIQNNFFKNWQDRINTYFGS